MGVGAVLGCALVALAGCGRIGFDGLGGGVDDPDASSVDAGPCLDPWGPATEIPTGLPDPKAPTITADGLELFLHDLNQRDIHVMTRTDRTQPFSLAQLLPSPPNTVDGDFNASISGDGLELFFTSSPSNAFIFRASRPTRTAPFGVAENCNAAGDGDISPDALVIYMQDFMSPVLEATRSSRTDSFGVATPLGPLINDGEVSSELSISSDGRELYFSSSRSGVRAIYVARRPGSTGAFVSVTAVVIGDLDGEVLNMHTPEISANGNELYFSAEDQGRYRLFVASRCGG